MGHAKTGDVQLQNRRFRVQVLPLLPLFHALKSGRIASAGLDVFEQDPTLEDNPLYELDNVILSPHVAGSDHLSRQAMGIEAANCIIDLSKGRWPGGAVVNGELKEKWSW